MSKNTKALLVVLGLSTMVGVFLFVNKRSAGSIVQFSNTYIPQATKIDDPILAKRLHTVTNSEVWEVIQDPITGIPLKVIGHRNVKYN